MSVEVGEHIPAEYTKTYIGNIHTFISDDSNTDYCSISYAVQNISCFKHSSGAWDKFGPFIHFNIHKL